MNLTTFLAKLDSTQRAQFAELAGTTDLYITMQLLGGHRSPSLRLLSSLVRASKLMFPTERGMWLSLARVNSELEAKRERRVRINEANP
jgi:hypothetical protein